MNYDFNENIQKAVLQHEKTEHILKMIIDGLNNGIKYYKGDIEEFHKIIEKQENEILKCKNKTGEISNLLKGYTNNDFCLWDKLHWYSEDDNIFLDYTPWFSDDNAQVSGLKIAINDVWAYEVIISKYRLYKDKFQYHLEVNFYDHFGLDAHDVKKQLLQAVQVYQSYTIFFTFSFSFVMQKIISERILYS